MICCRNANEKGLDLQRSMRNAGKYAEDRPFPLYMPEQKDVAD